MINNNKVYNNYFVSLSIPVRVDGVSSQPKPDHGPVNSKTMKSIYLLHVQ